MDIIFSFIFIRPDKNALNNTPRSRNNPFILKAPNVPYYRQRRRHNGASNEKWLMVLLQLSNGGACKEGLNIFNRAFKISPVVAVRYVTKVRGSQHVRQRAQRVLFG